MYKKSSGTLAAILGTTLAYLIVLAIKVAFFGSLGMSVVKTVSDKCGVTWKIEKLPLLTGDWFCE